MDVASGNFEASLGAPAVQRLSQRFRTPIVIEREVGVIRVAQKSSQFH